MMAGVHATRGVRRPATTGVLAAFAALVTVLAPVSTPRADAAEAFDVLQLNLCHSGAADCFEGEKPIDSAIATIKERQPAVVTLNEICARDITKMTKETGYLWEFTPAGDENTGGPYQCADGRGDYGIAILSHPEQGAGDDGVVERQYTRQDGGNEQRVLLCVPYSKFSACTTHLSADSGEIAAEQCQELMDVASGLGPETVIGGDLNLTYGGTPDVQDCVPEGWFRKGDGSVQHVMATDAYQFEGTEELPIEGTDHPGFLVKLTH